MEAVVVGNTTLDIICKTVDDVPRFESIAFDNVVVIPGGCGSNVAIGLQSCDISTGLIARTGEDDAGYLARRYWERLEIDLRFVKTIPGCPTGTSIGLVDSNAEPRFIHTSGANAFLTADAIPISELASAGCRALHIGGFFVLPGLLDGRLPFVLEEAQRLGLFVTLDVVRSPRMGDPTSLWPCLPYLDVFLCNAFEAQRLSGCESPVAAANSLLKRGCRYVIVKLGADGCWLEGESISERVPGYAAEVVDTTGAGDAFAAGLISAVLRGEGIRLACQSANAAGARIVSKLGAISGWLTGKSSKLTEMP